MGFAFYFSIDYVLCSLFFLLVLPPKFLLRIFLRWPVATNRVPETLRHLTVNYVFLTVMRFSSFWGAVRIFSLRSNVHYTKLRWRPWSLLPRSLRSTVRKLRLRSPSQSPLRVLRRASYHIPLLPLRLSQLLARQRARLASLGL